MGIIIQFWKRTRDRSIIPILFWDDWDSFKVIKVENHFWQKGCAIWNCFKVSKALDNGIVHFDSWVFFFNSKDSSKTGSKQVESSAFFFSFHG